MNLFIFIWGAVGQACLGLLVGRFGCQFFANHGFAGQLGVSTNQTNLRIFASIAQDLGHAVFQMCPRSKGAHLERTFCNPWGMLVQAV